MEITVRTYDEVSSERVRIEVPPGQRITIDIDGPVSNLVYDPEAAAEVMADNYQRARAVAADLETGMAKLERELADTRAELERATRGHVCTERCEENKHVAFLGRQRLDEAERELANERERRALAEENLASARASALPSARENTQAAELANLTQHLERIRAAVAGHLVLYAVRDALNSSPSLRGEQLLARTVAAVRDTFPAGSLDLT
jgi:phage FluMu protein gp41